MPLDDVCVFELNLPPTAKVIWRRGYTLKTHLTDWRSWELNMGPLVYKASNLSTTPQLLLIISRCFKCNIIQLLTNEALDMM